MARKDNNSKVRTDHLIPQFDGSETLEDSVKYSFESSYHEEDIIYTLREMFPEGEVELNLESRERIKYPEALRICAVVMKSISANKKVIWPKMNQVQSTVIENVKII